MKDLGEICREAQYPAEVCGNSFERGASAGGGIIEFDVRHVMDSTVFIQVLKRNPKATVL